MGKEHSEITDYTKIFLGFYPDREGKALEGSEMHFNHS